MQKYLDWATFTKLDNAMTLDYLSSLAASLAEQQQYPEKQLEILKQTIAARSSDWTKSEKSIVCSLTEERSDALLALIHRYGVAGFSLNHLRFGLRPLMANLLNHLAAWTDVSLKKGELVFNRPFFVRGAAGIERRELFSQVLYNLSQLLFDTMTDVRAALTEVSLMRPSDILDVTGDLERIDSDVSLQMGFAGVDEKGTFSRSETRALRRLSMSLSELAENAQEIFLQLSSNCLPSEELEETTAHCELLFAEVQRFSSLTLPKSESTVVWEMRRQAICFSLYSVVQILNELSDITTKAIAPSQQKNWQDLLSNDVSKRLAADLFTAGKSFEAASDASRKLIDYCLRHNTEPSQLIPAELKKIHPALSQRDLDLLLSLTSQDLIATPGGQISKMRISTGAKKIRKGMSATAPFAAPLAGFILALVSFSSFLGMTSCGVKTGLKSSIEDVRPSIPFREDASKPVLKGPTKDTLPATKTAPSSDSNSSTKAR